MRRSERCYTYKDVCEICNDYKNGLSVCEIQKKYGISVSVLYKILHKNIPISGFRNSGFCVNIKQKRFRKVKSDVLYALISDDDYELPVTPYVETLSELSRISRKNRTTLIYALQKGKPTYYISGRKRIKVKVIRLQKNKIENEKENLKNGIS